LRTFVLTVHIIINVVILCVRVWQYVKWN